ncbi:MAG: HAD family hydrolase [Firmicutes bacterium]|nr:HAD family hydrolase [Bacillota bacterium]
MNRYKLAIFDMDGTILNTIDDLANGVNHALASCGLPVRTVDYVRSIVGNGIFTTIKLCAPEGTDDKKLAELHAEFAPYYEKHRTDNTRPYSGVPELIAALKAGGVKTAVVSNKSDTSVKPLARQYFPGLFDMALGVTPGTEKKPAPDMVNIIMDTFGAAADETIYIGDSEVDIATAANAGINCISVTWGFRTRQNLAASGAETITDTPADVFKIICPDKN